MLIWKWKCKDQNQNYTRCEMTNGEKIRSMSNEDLAEWIAGIVGECELCPAYSCKLENGGCNITEDLKMWEVCWAIIADWLEAEAEENE